MFGWSSPIGALSGDCKVPVFDYLGDVKYIVGWCTARERIIESYQGAQMAEQSCSTYKLPPTDASYNLIYKSDKMKQVLKMLNTVSLSDASILLLGETGSGKEVLANYIHKKSNRRGKEMIVVNCAALTPSLFEAELFGYTRGSFTGAAPRGREGMIEAADQSTLFLDEIDSIPLELQGKLLRVLENKTVQRVGSNKSVSIDFRLIAATNKDLRKAVDEGKFRSNLYYRLNVVSVSIPPLRERRDDIRPLAEYFLERYCHRYGIDKTFDDNVFRQLEQYPWPGNVRELKHLVERAILTSDLTTVNLHSVFLPNQATTPATEEPTPPSRVTETALFSPEPSVDRPCTLNSAVSHYERQVILDAVKRNVLLSGAAGELEISLSTLERRMRKYGIAK